MSECRLRRIQRIHVRIWRTRCPRSQNLFFRPDALLNLNYPDWRRSIDRLSAVSGIAVDSYERLIAALEARRAFVKTMGAKRKNWSERCCGCCHQQPNLSLASLYPLMAAFRRLAACEKNKTHGESNFLSDNPCNIGWDHGLSHETVGITIGALIEHMAFTSKFNGDADALKTRQ